MKYLIIGLFIIMYLPTVKAEFVTTETNYIGKDTSIDTDIDGIVDSEDNCVYIPNANQLDSDNDNIGDVCDNCINVSNEDQKNTDGGLTYISTLIESTQQTYPIPYDIETDTENNVYICDFMNKKIIKYNDEFNKINEIQLDIVPSFTDINSSKNIYILSNYSKKVIIYNSLGEYISEFSLNNDLLSLRNIAVNDDNIFILTVTAVDKYTLSGELIISYPLECSNCVGFDVDKEGNMYISDVEENIVTKFDSNGNTIIKIGQTDTDYNLFKNPFDIKVRNDNNIYILDNINNNIQIFDSNGTFIERIQYEAEGEEEIYMFSITNDLSKLIISFDNKVNLYSLGDNLGDVCDNCVNIPNRNQYDGNNNQIGDVCEGIIIYECSLQHPNGICEEGKQCIEGDCVDINTEHDCSVEYPNGICQTGYECVDGNCVIINGDTNTSSGSDGCTYSATETRHCLVSTEIFMLFIMMIGLYILRKSLKTK